jgi:hypothetical protein
MNIRTLLVGVGIVGLGGLALMDYYGDDSVKARELSEIQRLAPDVQVPSCFPPGQNSKLLAAAIKVDQRSADTLQDEVTRRGVIKHDCIRGNGPATVQRLVKALGPEAVPLYATVLEKCPMVKDEYPVLSCFALDALGFEGGKDSLAAMEKAYAVRTDKVRKPVVLGALYRLMQAPGWKTPVQLAALIAPETEWEAKELLLEQIRAKKDPATRTELEKAYAAEKDEQEKSRIKAALLELDNPGRCVAEDEGRGEDGICRYTCRDQAGMRLKIPKQGKTCPLVREAPVAQPPLATSTPVSPAAPAAAPAAR